MLEQKCPIWQTSARYHAVEGRRIKVDSSRAGGFYDITTSVLNDVNHLDDQQKILLTSWLIEQRRLGVDCPEIRTDTLTSVSSKRPLSIHEKADYLLRYLALQDKAFGTAITFFTQNDRDPRIENELMAWTGSSNISSVISLAEYASAKGWINYKKMEHWIDVGRRELHEMQLWPPGYDRLEEIDGKNSGSRKAFVAMWFDPSLNEVYEKGLLLGIEDAGYEAIRIDGQEHNNKIDDEIIAAIRRCRFLVADFTQGRSGARGGVYYEAGFAHGLNIPVIFTCHKKKLKTVHFDTRQYNHIAWDDAVDLRERLSQRISATIGDGPFKKRS
jgi:hypothetical protein